MNRVAKIVPSPRILSLSLSFAICVVFCLASSPARGAWLELFNGTDLTNWQIGENADSFSVQDGMMVVNGPRAHAYYGPDGEADFKDFVFETEVMTTLGANSGIYFHTHYQSEDWPSTGYEAQINQTHSDPKKTGGLYAVQDNLVAVAQDYEWFHYEITVSGKRIVLKIDGQTITDYTEPDDLFRPWRQLGQGTFAIQSHHAGNPVYFRNMRVRPIPEPSSMVLAGCGMICVIAWRRRSFRRRSIGPIGPDPYLGRAPCHGRCRLKCGAIALVALALFAADARAVTIDTVSVGNAGNANDQSTGNLYGGVNYDYRMGTTEVTVGQYTAFLNAVAATDTYALYNPNMATSLYALPGIERSGLDGSHTYSVIGSPNKPVTFVSWGDAARFSNWLHNGQPAGVQDASTTEDGAYTLNGALTSEELYAAPRNAGATWFIPSENEWYKAAYHKNDGPTGNYWDYPTSTDTVPYSDQAPGNDAPSPSNTANMFATDELDNGYNDGYAVSGGFDLIDGLNLLTDAGAYAAATSPYGTFDQGGNVWEWTEFAFHSNGVRQIRGGSFDHGANVMLSSVRNYASASSDESWIIGFRVATVPEPSTGALAVLGCALLALRCRKHCRIGSVLLSSMLCVVAAQHAAAVTIDTVSVGNVRAIAP